MKPRSPKQAQRAVDQAVEAVIEQGGVIHEAGLWDAAEAALDGASPELLVETVNGTRKEPYRPKGGWRVG